MTNQNLAVRVEQARKILLHEQRTNHQDKAIRPGGLEAFVTRWVAETSPLCTIAGIDLHTLQHFMQHLEGYRQQDPMQRAASLRAALASLNELDGHAAPTLVVGAPFMAPAEDRVAPSSPSTTSITSI